MSEFFVLMVAYILFEGIIGQNIRKNRERKKLDMLEDRPEEQQELSDKFENRKKRIDKISIYLILAVLAVALIMNS
jgi:hypothetical protein|tara:strand:+ start:378 stop:605 length:228 start_codon:yes stop_codon:yes gene_type:complete